MDRLIRIRAEVTYFPEESNPRQNRFTFGYRIFISNDGQEPARLMRRHWRITNARGETREVVGDGVVGLQPTIHPGETFDYSSFCPLETSSGSMSGAYEMMTDSGDIFLAPIAEFDLVMPRSLHLVH